MQQYQFFQYNPEKVFFGFFPDHRPCHKSDISGKYKKGLWQVDVELRLAVVSGNLQNSDLSILPCHILAYLIISSHWSQDTVRLVSGKQLKNSDWQCQWHQKFVSLVRPGLCVENTQGKGLFLRKI